MPIENGLPFIFWVKVAAILRQEVVWDFLKKGWASFAIFLYLIIIDNLMIIPSKLTYKRFKPNINESLTHWLAFSPFFTLCLNVIAWCTNWKPPILLLGVLWQFHFIAIIDIIKGSIKWIFFTIGKLNAWILILDKILCTFNNRLSW